jgi:hypothetical protein
MRQLDRMHRPGEGGWPEETTAQYRLTTPVVAKCAATLDDPAELHSFAEVKRFQLPAEYAARSVGAFSSKVGTGSRRKRVKKNLELRS